MHVSNDLVKSTGDQLLFNLTKLSGLLLYFGSSKRILFPFKIILEIEAAFFFYI
jgi:hypothetical protein